MRKPHYFALALAIYAADQYTKHLATGLKHEPSLPVIPGLLHLTYVENAGIAWGLFADAGPDGRWILSLISLVAALGIALYAVRTPVQERMTQWGLALVLGGVLGNLTDRLLRGAVVDFLDLFIGRYRWPTFNLADVVITTGALLLLADALRPSSETRRHLQANRGPS
ncbi:MAG: signal peptidase II [Blastocatellia bacterium]|nr:signal peptidase II [Blastocatellia bacterium]MCS7156154.1 signal peptidase II [Blastocatellia bacterium]MCX7751495.1 signal peptidase II [Blastocatellia bacterium]MDW8169208.1 signal peptidase II [Acidobacteriota bacterium]MDW8256069.1 signal peptidase II [Acidobacteriota bacterium]